MSTWGGRRGARSDAHPLARVEEPVPSRAAVVGRGAEVQRTRHGDAAAVVHEERRHRELAGQAAVEPPQRSRRSRRCGATTPLRRRATSRATTRARRAAARRRASAAPCTRRATRARRPPPPSGGGIVGSPSASRGIVGGVKYGRRPRPPRAAVVAVRRAEEALAEERRDVRQVDDRGQPEDEAVVGCAIVVPAAFWCRRAVGGRWRRLPQFRGVKAPDTGVR